MTPEKPEPSSPPNQSFATSITKVWKPLLRAQNMLQLTGQPAGRLHKKPLKSTGLLQTSETQGSYMLVLRPKTISRNNKFVGLMCMWKLGPLMTDAWFWMLYDFIPTRHVCHFI